MYVGCGLGQACLIRIRGWSSTQVQPIAEVQVKVPQDREHWTRVDFSGCGFDEVTLLKFDVLDLATGKKGLLPLTLDDIKISREGYQWGDCFD